jgi:hypothetical protein
MSTTNQHSECNVNDVVANTMCALDISSGASNEDLLSKFLNLAAHLPAQGSADWLGQKQLTIGGSQIATVLGINKYENMEALILQKCGLSEFKKAPPLWFGTMMEPCIEQYVELTFGAKVHETGSLPASHLGLARISYSPDGLCVIDNDVLVETGVFTRKELADIHANDRSPSKRFESQDTLVLMEFKAPYMRAPVVGKIPEYYVPQPLLGMHVMEMVDVSIFIECVFRFCTLDDLTCDGYSRYHFDRNRAAMGKLPAVTFGLICIKGVNPSLPTEEQAVVLAKLKALVSQTCDFQQKDLGTIENKSLDSFMELVADRKVEVRYSEMIDNRPPRDGKANGEVAGGGLSLFRKYLTRDVLARYTGDEFMAYLPYKLLKVNTNTVRKNNILTDKVLDKVDHVFKCVEHVQALPVDSALDAKKEAIRRYVADHKLSD